MCFMYLKASVLPNGEIEYSFDRELYKKDRAEYLLMYKHPIPPKEEVRDISKYLGLNEKETSVLFSCTSVQQREINLKRFEDLKAKEPSNIEELRAKKVRRS